MTATRDETGEQTNIHEQTTITGKWIRRKFEGELRVDQPFGNSTGQPRPRPHWTP